MPQGILYQYNLLKSQKCHVSVARLAWSCRYGVVVLVTTAWYEQSQLVTLRKYYDRS